MIRDTYDDAKILEQATEALRDAPVPPGPPADVQATVSLLDGRVQPGGLEPPTKVPTRRFPMKRVLSLAAAVAVFAAIGLVAYHLFGGTSVAFAEVRRQIEQAQTMKCHMHMKMTAPSQAGELDITCYYKTPGLMRQEAVLSKTGEKAISTVNFQAGKILSLVPAQKQAVLVDMGQLPQAIRNKQMKMDFVAEMKNMVQGNAEELGFKTIDGQRLKGFRVTHNGQVMDVWVDPKTGMPEAMEMTLTDIGSMQMDRFVLGEEMNDALFSVVPPADYKVMNFQMPLGIATEADLVAGLRWLAENNDNTFPPTMAPTAKIIQRLQEQEKSKKAENEGLSEQEKAQKALETVGPMVRMSVFSQMVKDFHYVGDGVRLGDGDRIVCRYKPKEGANYRVVYGDLRIEDAPAEESQPTSAPAGE
jgi:outer membrane lipoprotein-sorting protein